MFKATKWSHKVITVSAALPSSNFVVGVENATPVSWNLSLIRVFRFRVLSRISPDVEVVASFVPM